MAERLPNGELVLMTEDVFQIHVRLDRERAIELEDVESLIRQPDAIYEDGRPTHNARGRSFAVRLKANPYGAPASPYGQMPKTQGRVKMKYLIVHLKRCREMLVFKAHYVSTALISAKLPPQARLRWERTT